MSRKLKQPGAYIIRFPGSEKIYVGSSGDLRMRKSVHKTLLSRGCHRNKRLQAEFDLAGDFEVEMIHCDTRFDALLLEQVLIDSLWGNPLLMNAASDASMSGSGRIVTDETRARISEATKDTHVSPVSICGKTYPSIKAAAAATETKRSTIRNRLNSPNFPEYKYLKDLQP